MTQRLLASIDDAGDIVLLLGTSLTIGHHAAGRADLTFLGDIDPVHATLALDESFHGGQTWTLAAADGASPPVVDGVALDSASGPRTLFDGDVVSFGASASFVVRRPDDASSSLLLELARGTECHGAPRVILMGPGQPARVRLGARRRRHVLIGGLSHDIELVSSATGGGDALIVRCDGGVKLAGRPVDPATELTLPLPVTGRLDLAVGAAPDRLPPFGIALTALTE